MLLNLSSFLPFCLLPPDFCLLALAITHTKPRYHYNKRLQIEIDVTSYSDVSDYLAYRFPEVWLFKNQQLSIYQYQLQDADYQLQTYSRYFPNFDLSDVIARCVQIAYDRNTSAAIRDLKQRLGNL